MTSVSPPVSSVPTEQNRQPIIAKCNRPTWASALWQAAAIFILAAVAGILTNQLRPNSLKLIGASPEGSKEAEGEMDGVSYVTIEEADALFTSQLATFVDARPQSAYEQGHIKGACNLPFKEFESKFKEVFSNVGPDAMVICYCDGGSCTLSGHLALELLGKGYGNVRVLKDGWKLWQERSLPVAKGLSAPCGGQ